LTKERVGVNKNLWDRCTSDWSQLIQTKHDCQRCPDRVLIRTSVNWLVW